MNSTPYRFLTLIAVLSLLGSGMLLGQTAVTGAITGYVSDASAAAVSGAEIETTNTADGAIYKTVTNDDGVYRFSSLIPGTYSIAVTKSVFAQFTRRDIRVEAGTAVRIDAKMAVAR